MSVQAREKLALIDTLTRRKICDDIGEQRTGEDLLGVIGEGLGFRLQAIAYGGRSASSRVGRVCWSGWVEVTGCEGRSEVRVLAMGNRSDNG